MLSNIHPAFKNYLIWIFSAEFSFLAISVGLVWLTGGPWLLTILVGVPIILVVIVAWTLVFAGLIGVPVREGIFGRKGINEQQS